MTIEEAVNLLTVKHLENKVKKWIRDPVAYTLHEVWQIADSEVTYHPSNLQQTCNHVATHGDELRAMSDEELANWLCSISSCHTCDAVDQCGRGTNGWISWLRSPADGGDGDA